MVFQCINIRQVPREVLKTEASYLTPIVFQQTIGITMGIGFIPLLAGLFLANILIGMRDLGSVVYQRHA